jgi:hypothetical protein
MKLEHSEESFLECEFSTETLFRILPISKNWHVKRQKNKLLLLNINRRKLG